MGVSGTPTLRAHSPARQAGRPSAYYEHARSYNRDTAVFQPFRRAVVEALPLRRGHVVLDVGCGTGLCFGLLRERVGPCGTIVGIEESPEMAAVAREHVACEGWRNVTVVSSPAEDARLEVTADAALFCAVHDIMQSPGALWNVMVELRPGAWVAAGGGKWAALAEVRGQRWVQESKARREDSAMSLGEQHRCAASEGSDLVTMRVRQPGDQRFATESP